MIRFLHVKIFIKNAPMRILIARESAPCQPLCSLTFEIGGEKEGKKNQTRAWGGHWSLRPILREAGFAPPLGKTLRCVLGFWATVRSLTRNMCASKAWIESDTFENTSTAEICLSSLS